MTFNNTSSDNLKPHLKTRNLEPGASNKKKGGGENIICIHKKVYKQYCYRDLLQFRERSIQIATAYL